MQVGNGEVPPGHAQRPRMAVLELVDEAAEGAGVRTAVRDIRADSGPGDVVAQTGERRGEGGGGRPLGGRQPLVDALLERRRGARGCEYVVVVADHRPASLDRGLSRPTFAAGRVSRRHARCMIRARQRATAATAIGVSAPPVTAPATTSAG